MTLLIGTVARSRNPHVVVTADGRSTGFDGVTRTIQSDTQQKVFPIPGAPVVIAHHGENLIAGIPVTRFISDLFSASIRSSTIDEITDFLRSRANQPIEDTLRRIRTSKQVGFWIAGFGHGRREPEIRELLWKKEFASGKITTSTCTLHGLVLGGDAQEFVAEYRAGPIDSTYHWEKANKRDVDYASKLHNKLYGIAAARQSQQQKDVFGGHRHQVSVTSTGWKWIVAPAVTESSMQEEIPQ